MDTLITRYKDKLDRKDDRRRLKESLWSRTVLRAKIRSQIQSTLPIHRPLPPPLVKPVFIPQRRQADRLRGFQLLYAPDLAASGVTEPEFLHFLNTLNAAIGFDNRVKILNFAVDVGTIACSSWEVLVATIGAQALTTAAMHVKSRAKSQAYIAMPISATFIRAACMLRLCLSPAFTPCPRHPMACNRRRQLSNQALSSSALARPTSSR